jgi:hypothetical protein
MTSTALGDQLMFAGFAIAGGAFVTVVFLHIRLKHYVVKEKVHAIEDASKLWLPGYLPAKIALNEKGSQLRRYSNVSTAILLIAVGVATNVSASSRLSIILLITVVISFLATSCFESRLKNHISSENILAIDDVSTLWKFSLPPKNVLNEKGLRLHRYMRAAATVFFIGIGIVFIGIFTYGVPDHYS